MKLKYFILVFLTILFGYLLKTDLSCYDFNGNFHYSSQVISFHAKELIATETNTPLFIVRSFHNKLTVFLFDIFSRYIRFFNIFYLINILSLSGLFGLLYFYFSLFSKLINNKFIKLFGVLILLLPFFEIFQIVNQTFYFKILIFILPFQVASFIGSVLFIKRGGKFRYGIYFLLLIVSIGWIIVFQNELLNFCTAK